MLVLLFNSYADSLNDCAVCQLGDLLGKTINEIGDPLLLPVDL